VALTPEVSLKCILDCGLVILASGCIISGIATANVCVVGACGGIGFPKVRCSSILRMKENFEDGLVFCKGN
jgi:hypothetical protein